MWIDSQNTTELLDNSLNSRLQFYLSTLVCQFRDESWGRCDEMFTAACDSGVRHHMAALLPPSTEQCVVDIATKLTIDKARAKCDMWWSTMVTGVVERQVQTIAEVYMKQRIKKQSKEVGKVNDELRLGLKELESIFVVSDEDERIVAQECGIFIQSLKSKPAESKNLHLFQRITDATMKILIRYMTEYGFHIRPRFSAVLNSEESGNDDKINSSEFHDEFDLEPIFESLLILRDKKGVEIPLVKIPSKVLGLLFGGDQDLDTTRKESISSRFVHVCVRLLYIGVLSPPRLEHWLLWFFETCSYTTIRDEVCDLAELVISRYRGLKSDILEGRTPYVPGVAHFLKQYSVSEFEILKEKMKISE